MIFHACENLGFFPVCCRPGTKQAIAPLTDVRKPSVALGTVFGVRISPFPVYPFAQANLDDLVSHSPVKFRV